MIWLIEILKTSAERTSADQVLRNIAFNIAKDPKYDAYQKGLASMVYNRMQQNEQLTEELHKFIIRKFRKGKVYSAFKDNILGADLADMQLSKFNKGFNFLLCLIDIFSKYAWVIPLKDKKGVSIVSALQSILKKSSRKPNKIWVDKGGEFCNNSF